MRHPHSPIASIPLHDELGQLAQAVEEGDHRLVESAILKQSSDGKGVGAVAVRVEGERGERGRGEVVKSGAVNVRRRRESEKLENRRKVERGQQSPSEYQ